jgi:hypothetical protein
MDIWSVTSVLLDPCLIYFKETKADVQGPKELKLIVSKLEKDVEAWNTVSCGILPGQA